MRTRNPGTLNASARRPVAVVVVIATVGLAWAGVSPAAGGVAARTVGRSDPSAHAAAVLNATDTAYLHMVGESGSLIAEEGTASGQLPGTVRARFNIGATITAYYTIYPRGGGSISGHGSATLHSSGAYASFGGTMSVNHGTGRFAHAHGTGGLYGVINRRTYALTVQTTGKLYY
jgi:hypothetical protein